MTGEVTLRGKVLAVGGLKEKVMAAYRAGIRTVVFPADNQKDLVEIPESVRNAMKFLPVSTVDEVFQHAFVGVAERIAELEAKQAEAEKRRKERAAARRKKAAKAAAGKKRAAKKPAAKKPDLKAARTRAARNGRGVRTKLKRVAKKP